MSVASTTAAPRTLEASVTAGASHEFCGQSSPPVSQRAHSEIADARWSAAAPPRCPKGHPHARKKMMKNTGVDIKFSTWHMPVTTPHMLCTIRSKEWKKSGHIPSIDCIRHVDLHRQPWRDLNWHRPALETGALFFKLQSHTWYDLWKLKLNVLITLFQDADVWNTVEKPCLCRFVQPSKNRHPCSHLRRPCRLL